jgi:hypothetical protein
LDVHSGRANGANRGQVDRATVEQLPAGARWNVAALEPSDNVADRSHAFAGLKRGYFRQFNLMVVLSA